MMLDLPQHRIRRRHGVWRQQSALSWSESLMPPETRCAKSGDVHIAYQVTGVGPLDLVYVPGWVSHVEYQWEQPAYARALLRLASFSRLIVFDKRGTGLSDRVSEVASLEQRIDDARVVMDAVGSERAALFGVSEGGPMSLLFAATYPERTSAPVSSTLKDLVVGSGIQFEERGAHVLKGVPGEWRLFAVGQPAAP